MVIAVTKPSVSVAITAYNEADGIGGFLQEIEDALIPHTASVSIVVVDDASTDATSGVIEEVASRLRSRIVLISNRRNRGHGPSLMTAYRRALEGSPDYILQVDGDGQFHGSDLRRVLVLLEDDAHAVSGVRRFRVDPWFRMAMSRLVRHYVSASFAVPSRDPNCPLRGYEAGLLGQLLRSLPEECLIPNLYLTILSCRRGVPLLEVDVSHRVRRGASPEGTTWRGNVRSPIPLRLVQFSVAALRESRRFRAGMDDAEGAQDDIEQYVRSTVAHSIGP
jgi:dolichol-phosphate mannosyltransferase